MATASSSADPGLKQPQSRVVTISQPVPRQWPGTQKPPPPPRMTGTQVHGRYHILRRLGEGASCRVYEAIRTEDNLRVAVKILLRTNTTGMARFQRELTIHRRLKHPNIVSLLDAGYRENRPFLVMEYLQGKSLEEILEERRTLNPRHILSIIEGIASGLSAMHGNGFVHRDLKPSNIFIGRASVSPELTVKLIDFGLSKGLAELTNLAQDAITEENRCCGTPRYMAPEHILGSEAGPPADVYALGAVMWEMLTGAAPYPDPDPLKVMHAHVEEPLPELDAYLPAGSPCPLPLRQVILRALTKDPLARYPNGNALLYALRDARRRMG